MRTTLAIDDDVLAAAKGIAEVQHKTVGEVISSLARKALQPTQAVEAIRNGIQLLPIQPGAGISTPELVKQLLDELP